MPIFPTVRSYASIDFHAPIALTCLMPLLLYSFYAVVRCLLYHPIKSVCLTRSLEPRGLTGEGLGSRQLQALVRLGDPSWVADADFCGRVPLCFYRFSCLYGLYCFYRFWLNAVMPGVMPSRPNINQAV